MASALIAMPKNSEASQVLHGVTWRIPRSYQPVHDLLKALKLSPYERYGEFDFMEGVQRYRWAIVGIFVIFIGILAFAVYVAASRQRLAQVNVELLESENLQRLLMENLPVGVAIIDPKTRQIERINDTFRHMLDRSIDEVIGKVCHNFVCPAHEGRCPVCDLGQTIDYSERSIIRADGTLQEVLKSVQFIKIKGQDKLLECVIDITDRKEAEKKLANSEKKLSNVF